jgi:hypothetical protein
MIMIITVFWEFAPFAVVETAQCLKRLRLSFFRHQHDDYLMMEAANTSETSLLQYQTTQRKNPEERIFILTTVRT